MRRLSLFLVALCLMAAVAPGGAQVPDPSQLPIPGGILPGGPSGNNSTSNSTGPVVTPQVLQLYQSSLVAAYTGVGSVETLVAAAPTKTADSSRDILNASAAWYAVPGTVPQLRDTMINGNVAGTLWLSVDAAPSALPAPLPIPLGVVVSATVDVALDKVSAAGNASQVANTTIAISTTVAPGAPQVSAFNWTISGVNTTVAAGEGLALNVSVSQQQSLSALSVLYDSAAHPSGFNMTLMTMARPGSLVLSAATQSRDAQPGGTPTYVVTVRNLGANTDTVAFNATGSPGDWGISFQPVSLSVGPGASGSTLLTVRVPSTAQDGAKHTATVTATGASGAASTPLQFTTTVRATPVQNGAPCTSAGVPTGCGCAVNGQTDSDCDGWTDVDEHKYGSNAFDRNSTPDTTDSDGDGYSNKAEVDAGCDPNNGNDVPLSGSGCGAPSAIGGAGGAAGGLFGPLSDALASSLGVSSQTADLVAGFLILIFLLILLLLIWLLLGGYPVKVTLVEPRATTEPGRAADYTVEVRSKLRKPQQVDLEVAGLPNDWDVRLNNPRLSLEPKASQTVGVLVRPPDNWPAPSKRDFQVRARSRLKPGKFAKSVAKLLVQPRAVVPEIPPAEDAVPEPAYEPAAPTYEPPGQAYVPPIPPPPPPPARAPAPAYVPPASAPFRIGISGVRHAPEVPERGGEVTTTARLDNQGNRPERVRVLLVVNGKIRDEITADLAPGEGAEAEFHWVAYLARNEVKVVAERS